jgi:hypothetical protein
VVAGVLDRVVNLPLSWLLREKAGELHDVCHERDGDRPGSPFRGRLEGSGHDPCFVVRFEKVYARRLVARPNPVLPKGDCDRRIGIIRLLYNVGDVISLNAKLKLTLRLPTQTFCAWLHRGLAADGLYLAKPVSP